MAPILLVVHPERPAAWELAEHRDQVVAGPGREVIELRGRRARRRPRSTRRSLSSPSASVATAPCCAPSSSCSRPGCRCSASTSAAWAISPRSSPPASSRPSRGCCAGRLRRRGAHGPRGGAHRQQPGPRSRRSTTPSSRGPGPGHTIRVAVEIAGRPFLTYVADGILVSTPTGRRRTTFRPGARSSPPAAGDGADARVAAHALRPLPRARAGRRGPPHRRRRPGRGRGDRRRPRDRARRWATACLCRPAAEPARLISFGERDFHSALRHRFGLADS